MVHMAPFKIRQEVLRIFSQSSFDRWTRAQWQNLANKVYRYQIRNNSVFRKWCLSKIKKPSANKHTFSKSRFPLSLPIVAFKETSVRSFCPPRKTLYFESSGTTAHHRKTVSHHYFRSFNLYRASVIEGWEWFLRMRCHVPVCKTNFMGLMPSFRENPHSSLSCMVSILMEEFGDGHSLWCMHRDRWDWHGLSKHLQNLQRNSYPAVLFGTAFGWVHFIDWCAKYKNHFKLSPNALIIETGGYKGRSRQLTKTDLYSQLSNLLGVDRNNIVSEYSMCELSSQAYSFPAKNDDAYGKFLFRFPPWCRYRVTQPGSSKPVLNGRRGVLEIHDLANLDSCAFIRTEDMAINHKEGFELVGRLPQAGLKGCSLAFE